MSAQQLAAARALELDQHTAETNALKAQVQPILDKATLQLTAAEQKQAENEAKSAAVQALKEQVGAACC